MREISESYRYIVRSPDVRGGNARVEGTRIAVHDVIGLLLNGESVESITAHVPNGGRKGLPYETISSWKGVDHLDRIDPEHAVVLRRGEGGSLTLESLPLP